MQGHERAQQREALQLMFPECRHAAQRLNELTEQYEARIAQNYMPKSQFSALLQEHAGLKNTVDQRNQARHKTVEQTPAQISELYNRVDASGASIDELFMKVNQMKKEAQEAHSQAEQRSYQNEVGIDFLLHGHARFRFESRHHGQDIASLDDESDEHRTRLDTHSRRLALSQVSLEPPRKPQHVHVA